MEPDPDASDAEQGLAQRRAAMFATLGFNELARVPPGLESSSRTRHAWLDRIDQVA
jgi:hypothetical protein